MDVLVIEEDGMGTKESTCNLFLQTWQFGVHKFDVHLCPSSFVLIVWPLEVRELNPNRFFKDFQGII